MAPGHAPDFDAPYESYRAQRLFEFQQRVNRLPPRIVDTLAPFVMDRLRPFAPLLSFQLDLPLICQFLQQDSFVDLTLVSNTSTRDFEIPQSYHPHSPRVVLRPFLRYDLPRFDNSLPSPNRRLKTYIPPYGFNPSLVGAYQI